MKKYLFLILFSISMLEAANLERSCNERQPQCGDDYECNMQICLIKNAHTLEQAIKYDLENSKNYENDKVNKAFAKLDLPKDFTTKHYEINMCLDDDLQNCTTIMLDITRKNENEMRFKWNSSTDDSLYEKNYKKTENGVEVVSENYI